MTLRSRRLAATGAALAVACSAALAAVAPAASAAGAAPDRQASTTVVVTLRNDVDLSTITGSRAARLRAVKARLRQGADASQAPLIRSLASATAQGRAQVRESLWISDSVVVTATPDVLAQIASRPEVVSVEPDAVTLTPAASGSTNQVSVRSPEVWSAGDTGAGVVVATLDSGVDVTHPDLAARGGEAPTAGSTPTASTPTYPPTSWATEPA